MILHLEDDESFEVVYCGVRLTITAQPEGPSEAHVLMIHAENHEPESQFGIGKRAESGAVIRDTYCALWLYPRKQVLSLGGAMGEGSTGDVG